MQPGAIVMAVPKKRQSKMKTRQRKANVRARASPRLASSAAGCPLRVAALALIRRASSLVCAQWFAKARRQATLALSRGKGLKYDPLADPKYSFDAPEDDEDDDEEEDDEEEIVLLSSAAQPRALAPTQQQRQPQQRQPQQQQTQQQPQQQPQP